MADGKIIMQLTLEKGLNTEGTLYRVKKGWYIHFLVGSTLQGNQVRFFTNCPIDEKSSFHRENYREIPVENPTLSGCEFDTFDNYFELFTSQSGAFEFHFTTNNDSLPSGSGYFIVDPQFSVGTDGRTWELDGVIVQTYLAKNLGHFSEWMERLEVSHKCNYNMVHFTPLQELGYSKSCYSLRDQLKVNPWFSSPGGPTIDWNNIAELVQKLETDWGMLCMTDLVYNHTASDSPWVQEHPECTYNLVNSPHLRPAYLLDRIIFQVSLDAARNKYTDDGLSDKIEHDGHIEAIRNILHREIARFNIHEYFLADTEREVDRFAKFLNDYCHEPSVKCTDTLKLIPDLDRFGAKVDYRTAASLFYDSKGQDKSRACELLREKVNQLNGAAYETTQSHLNQAVENVLANARYRFLDPSGPKVQNITADSPIMWDYFKQPDGMELPDVESLMSSDRACYVMAYNGWVMNDDPLRCFADSDSNVYLRRELIVWGDSVKLRYGNEPKDCPYLWQRMTEYTELTARLFHAVRLDNCHGTPLHVAQYMLDKARAVRNNLYIVAELFTGSEHVDNIFINKLGINSLIREAQSAGDSHEEGRLVYRYGGLPVGAFMQPAVRPLVPSIAHALFYDLTHDNMSPVVRRSAADLLPSGALVIAACCAAASTRGYDELVPHYIDVVHEMRVYARWGREVGADTGIISAKAALNRLHTTLAKENFTEGFVDQVDGDVVAVTRHCPQNHHSVVIIAHTAFHNPGDKLVHRAIRPIQVPGRVRNVEVLALLQVASSDKGFVKNAEYINGLNYMSCFVRENFELSHETEHIVQVHHHNEVDSVELHQFPPGSVIALRVQLPDAANSAIDSLKHCLATQFSYRVRATSRGQLLLPGDGVGSGDATIDGPSLRELVSGLSLTDLNLILFRCGAEENADAPGHGAYGFSGYKTLEYCGIQGIMSELAHIRAHNDLGHPVCNNLRDGNWLLDYTADRLMRYPGTVADVGQWLRAVFQNVGHIPRYLVPCYFDAVITGVYSLLMKEMWSRLGNHVTMGSTIVRSLALGSVQFCGVGANSELPQLADSVRQECKSGASLAAGFPHFAEGVFRNWGRDTFISLRGLLLLHDRYDDALAIILGYAGVLRHGLIPNLLGCHGGAQARFNCRDAVWWWLQSIKAYHQQRPEDDVLKKTVHRIFPHDDSDGFDQSQAKDMPLLDVIVEALQRHVTGIDFIERGSGPGLDEHMTPEGFHVTAGIDLDTGFPFGGNRHNCGTWMDKMGSSSNAGNRGVPATPRDGSAVELVALCYSTVNWLADLAAKRVISVDGVTTSAGSPLTWREWAEKIKANFESKFWIPWDTEDPSLKTNRGIYRDSVNSSHGYTDNQMRPNYLVALALVPECFTPEKAWFAIDKAETILLGPLGIATLSRTDWAYHGSYDNSNSSNDYAVSRGFNYHQGPEWLWPVGFFFRAQLHFAQLLQSSGLEQHRHVVGTVISNMQHMLARHMHVILSSSWRSLPELTNENGSWCRDSCPAQAWSIACLYEALHDLLQLKISN